MGFMGFMGYFLKTQNPISYGIYGIYGVLFEKGQISYCPPPPVKRAFFGGENEPF